MPTNGGVKILVRVRPMLARELAFDNAVEVLSNQEILVYKPDQEFASTCDQVLGVQATQDDVYQCTRDTVVAALAGYNNTIIAYGQTGTGKTHTMMGDHATDVLESDPEVQRHAFGLIPRAVHDLFAHAKMLQSRQGCVVNVVASYVEIYNDRLYDLLQPYKQESGRDPMDVNKRKAMLEVREDQQGNTYVPDLMTVKVKSPRSVLQLISKGNRNRALRHTEMNIHSSRSHALLQLLIEQWPDGGRSGKVVRSKLNFVDLAGSERWNTKVEMAADRVNELTAINSSLSALASVVAALSEGRQHVPYRTSKLTHLLQDSLGGNCRTTIISTVSPSVDAFEETVSTLKFADRAGNIGNNPIVNVSRDMTSVLELKEKEIQRLRGLLTQLTAAAAGGTAGQAVDAALVAEAVEEFGEGANAAGTYGDNAVGKGGTQAMREELRAMKRALDDERALRADLEARLQHAGLPLPSSAPTSSLPQDLSSGPSVAAFGYDSLRMVTPPAGLADTSTGLPLSATPGGDAYGLFASWGGGTAGRTLAWGDMPTGKPKQQRRQQHRQQQRSVSTSRRSAALTSPTRRSAAPGKGGSLDEAIQAIRLRIAQLSTMGGTGGGSRHASPTKVRSASNSCQGQRSGSAGKGANDRYQQLQSTYGVSASMADRDAPGKGASGSGQRAAQGGGPHQSQQVYGSGAWGTGQPLHKSLSAGNEPSTLPGRDSGSGHGTAGMTLAAMTGTPPSPAREGRSALLAKFADDPAQGLQVSTASSTASALDSPVRAALSPAVAMLSSPASTCGGGAAGSWGRSALLAAAGAMGSPTSTAALGGGGGYDRSPATAASHTSNDQQLTTAADSSDYIPAAASPSAQLPPQAPRPFGRSALGLVPTYTGRSSILALASPSLSTGAMALQPAAGQWSPGSPGGSSTARSSSVPRFARNSGDHSSGLGSSVSSERNQGAAPRRDPSPARLDKGSLIYIFGASSSSIKAKALANM